MFSECVRASLQARNLSAIVYSDSSVSGTSHGGEQTGYLAGKYRLIEILMELDPRCGYRTIQKYEDDRPYRPSGELISECPDCTGQNGEYAESFGRVMSAADEVNSAYGFMGGNETRPAIKDKTVAPAETARL
jgi:hypothetical protein